MESKKEIELSDRVEVVVDTCIYWIQPKIICKNAELFEDIFAQASCEHGEFVQRDHHDLILHPPYPKVFQKTIEFLHTLSISHQDANLDCIAIRHNCDYLKATPQVYALLETYIFAFLKNNLLQLKISKHPVNSFTISSCYFVDVEQELLNFEQSRPKDPFLLSLRVYTVLSWAQSAHPEGQELLHAQKFLSSYSKNAALTHQQIEQILEYENLMPLPTAWIRKLYRFDHRNTNRLFKFSVSF